MSDGANEAVQTPGGVMLAAGGVLALYYALSALWKGIGLLLGCMGTGFSGLALVSGDGDTTGAAVNMGFGVWGLVLGAIAFVVYLGLAGGGAYVASGGMAMRSMEELDKVRKCVTLAAALPVVGIITTVLTSLLAFNCCGLVVGTIPDLIVTGLGIAAFYLSNEALKDPSVTGAFKS